MWSHDDLEQKWTEAGALVYGQPAQVAADELESLYNSHYESDSLTLAYSICIWPLGHELKGWRPCLVGSGDLFFRVANGQNRWNRFAPYELKELRREEAGWNDQPLDDEASILRGMGERSARWHVVAPQGVAVSLYYGLLIKPGKVPEPMPEGLSSARGQMPGAKAHPRSVVGAWLCDAGPGAAVAFDPSDARVGVAKRAIAQALPETRPMGFILIPTQTVRATSPAPPSASAPSAPPRDDDTMAGWRRRLEATFGPLELDGESLCSGRLRGEIFLRSVAQAEEDVVEAWYQTSTFALNDREATAQRWDTERTSLVTIEVDFERVAILASISCRDGGYLIVLQSFDIAPLKALLGIPRCDEGVCGDWVLGHG